MGFFRGLGRMVKPLVNIPKWMSAKQITADAAYISQIAKQVLTPQKAQQEETFEAALQRLNLTEQDLRDRKKEFTRLAGFFFVVFILLVGYVVYLILDSTGEVSWRAILLSIVVSLIALVQFFRFHFWLYQIKERRLGCSFKQYLVSGILGVKS